MDRFSKNAARGIMVFQFWRTGIFAVAVLMGISQPLAAQEFTDGQQLLREAAAARPPEAVTVADEYVRAARYDAGGGNLHAAAKSLPDTAGPSLSKPLPPRSSKPGDSASSTSEKPSRLTAPSATTLAGGACVVLSIFFAGAWLLKRSAPKSMQSLPAAAVEVLGAHPLVRGQHLQLVRCGQRLLLLGVSANSAQTLAELSDHQEVAALLAACGDPAGRFAPHVENPRIERDHQRATADRVSDLLTSVTSDARRAALSGGSRHA